MGAQVVLGFPRGNDVKLISTDSQSANRYRVSSLTLILTLVHGLSSAPTARLKCMEDLSAEEFEMILDEALDQLPAGITDELDNVALFIENRPEDGDEQLLGLYDGTPVGERGIAGLELPDNIFLYRDNLIAFADDRDHLRSEIVVTIVHEIAHFYGIDDDRLHEIGWG